MAFVPLFICLGSITWRRIHKYFLFKSVYEGHENNTVDNIKYVERNAGPEYNIQVKTSYVNAMIFNCILFGQAFPILYAFTLVGLII